MGNHSDTVHFAFHSTKIYLAYTIVLFNEWLQNIQNTISILSLSLILLLNIQLST